MENWKEIPDFPGYSVSSFGQVRNDDHDRILTILRNQAGVCHVGMTFDRKQYKRSLALLVAEAFVDRPPKKDPSIFNVPIHLDGHQSNNRFDNLMWRPHWFSMKYNRQFKMGPTSANPVVEIRTQERYVSPWSAALAFGLLEKEVIASALDRTYVWPTFQEFRFIAE